MNKVAKILSAVVSVTVALSLALAMLTSAIAAPTTTFSVNVVEDTDEKIVVTVVLEDGSFQSIDFGIDYNEAKIEKCSDMQGTNAFTASVNAATCLFSAAIVDGYDVKGAVLATYTFDKIDAADIGPEDITLVVDVCGSITEQYDVVIENNIPEIEAPSEDPSEPSEDPSEPSEDPSEPSEDPSEPSEDPSEPSEDPSEPSEDPSEPSEDPSEPSEDPSEPSEDPSEPSEDPSEPSEDPSEPSEDPSEPSEDPSEPSEEVTKPSEDDKTDAPADDKTDAPAADEDVVNPDTGDSVTASAAIVSLLAISGAAIVALRKKED